MHTFKTFDNFLNFNKSLKVDTCLGILSHLWQIKLKVNNKKGPTFQNYLEIKKINHELKRKSKGKLL